MMATLIKDIFPLASRLIIIIDPIGNIPLFLAFLHNLTPRRTRRIILQEMVIALAVMVLFAFCGTGLLKIINVDQRSIGTSGGLILLLIATKMVFPDQHGPIAESKGGEPFLFPLAIPLIAGPSMLVTLIDMGKKIPLKSVVLGLIIAWALCTMILLTAAQLQRFLGARGVAACERIMGLLLVFISTQMFLNGLTEYFR